MDWILAGVIVLCGLVTGRDALRNVLDMDIHTRHSIRCAYVAICAGCAMLILSLVPFARWLMEWGAAALVLGVAGLVVFNRRRVFERDAEDRTLVLNNEDMTQAVSRSTIRRVA